MKRSLKSVSTRSSGAVVGSTTPPLKSTVPSRRGALSCRPFCTNRRAFAGSLTGLALCLLLSSLGTSIANVALPTVATVFGAAFSSVQWVPHNDRSGTSHGSGLTVRDFPGGGGGGKDRGFVVRL